MGEDRCEGRSLERVRNGSREGAWWCCEQEVDRRTKSVSAPPCGDAWILTLRGFPEQSNVSFCKLYTLCTSSSHIGAIHILHISIFTTE
jgi:hypothetical protein